jgi:hypothetical protein
MTKWIPTMKKPQKRGKKARRRASCGEFKCFNFEL